MREWVEDKAPWRREQLIKNATPTAAYRPKLVMMRRQRIVGVYMTCEEQRKHKQREFRAIVAEWPQERIKALPEKCQLPKTRCCAMLGIGMNAFGKLVRGDFTPSPALCRRFALLEGMAERGELHNEYIPKTSEMRRRMTLFRAWWFAQLHATPELPIVEVTVRVRWGRNYYHALVLPIESIPKLRLTKWEGLSEVIKALTVAVRKQAAFTGHLLWTEGQTEYWKRYANNTLPKLVVSRAREAWLAERKKKEAKGLNEQT